MKYLKLFEAFESLKLSRVLNFLKKSSQSKFLDEVKFLCKYLDYPISKLTDDDFEYVPYRKALSIDRPDADGNLELVKFWFDKDGNYITKTGINGKKLSIDTLSTEFSNDPDDYELTKEIYIDDLRDLPTGTKIYLRCSDGEGIGYLYKYSGATFILQDFAYGTQPSDYGDEEWRKIRPNSWIISSEDDYHEMSLAHPKSNILDDSEGDPNLGFTISKERSEESHRVGKGRWVTNYKLFYHGTDIKDSHFALILDITNLKNISLSDITSQREERKKGAFLTDQEIKKSNIERYLNKILGSDNFLSDPNKVITKLLKDDYSLFLIYNNSIKDHLESFSNNYYHIIKGDGSEKDIEYFKGRIKEGTKNLYKLNKSKKSNIVDNINKFKSSISEWRKTGDYGVLDREIVKFTNSFRDFDKALEATDKQLDLLVELSNILNDKLLSDRIENIYDLEMLIYKMESLSRIFNNSRNKSHRVMSYLFRNANANYDTFVTVLLNSSYNDPIEWVDKAYPRLKELIERL